MYGLCFPPGSQQFFFLNKGKGIGSPICRAAPRGCRRPFYPPPIPLGHKAGESKGVLPLVPEVQEPGGSWRIFAYFLYARK